MAVTVLLAGFGAVASRADQAEGAHFAAELRAPEAEALQAVHEVLEDQIVHGTKMYERESTLTDAEEAATSTLFPPWQGPGKVFYKIRRDVIAPRHFPGAADMGTIAVRYVVTSVTSQRTRVQIDAVFEETAHRRMHVSDGTVESSEFKAIQERLQSILFTEQETAELKIRRDSADLVKQTIIRRREDESTMLASAQSSVKDLEEKLKDLRRDVERRVKAPGTDLKAAPFVSSAKLATLPAYTELVIVILTPNWYGVETPDGQRGWIEVDRLEPLP